MDERHQRLVELTRNLGSNEVSRATSPGGPQSTDLPTRTRTFPYDELLPYKVEDNQSRQDFLHTIIENLYVAVRSHDYQLNAARWTRELKTWLSLKFTMSKQERVVLAQLYFELVLASGLESSASERFTSMLSLLLKRKSYLVPIDDLILDWRPLLERLKLQVIERRSSTSWSASYQPSLSSLKNIAPFVQPYFDPDEAMDLLSETLQYFNTSNIEEAYTSIQLLNLLFPTSVSQAMNENGSYQQYLPTFFHLWGILGRSKLLDTTFLDLLSRMARDALTNEDVPFSQHGIFTLSQSKAVFTAVLRLLELPVGQSTSSYPVTSSSQDSFGLLLEKDTKRFPSVYHIARLIVMSLSPSCLEHENSTLYDLEGLLQAVENFFHPSNAGSWSHRLPRFVYFLADFFTMRWSREKSGEMNVTPDRKLTPELKKRFVLCLKEPVMLGLYSKSETAQSYALSALKNLAYLEPDEILPAALQRIYPSIQGLVEVHRTLPSLRALQTITGEIIRHRGYRCHLTTLLGFILPGIDPNDLMKTTFTLHVLQGVCYQVPLHDISKGGEGLGSSAIAMDWITSELEQMELAGPSWQPNYSETLSEEQADLIARSSTAGLTEFVSAFLGKIFTLLENLPDPAKSKRRSSNPEENVINILPAVFTPLMAALSGELYDIVLERVCKFVSEHVIHQARDAMAFILNSICRVNPEKALKKIVPIFVAMIHVEIDENGAGSSRQTGTDVLPRDRGLVWAVSLLSMSIVHTGAAILEYETEIVETIDFVQQRCRGTVGIHISNLIHHLLINLTGTYTSDYRIFEESVSNAALGPNDWGRLTPADKLTIRWHVPSEPELELAIRLFLDQTKKACETLSQLVNNTNTIKRGDGTKAWSDELSRNLVLLRLVVSGAATLFVKDEDITDVQIPSSASDGRMDTDDDEDYDDNVDAYDEAMFSFDCARGRTADIANTLSNDLKGARKLIALTVHQVHACLVQEEPDDISSFTSLHSAYKSLLVDVGFEKTAKVLDRVTRVYASDIAPYKMSGVRKHYPRSILLRRAYVYHLQRMRENVKPRQATAEEYQMMYDLAESSVSVYTSVRKSAQSSLDAIFKVVTKGRVRLLPIVVKSLQEGVATSDYGKIKGPLYMLLYGSLSSRLGRDWRYIPTVTHGFLQAYEVDRLSIQKLCSGGTNSLINMMWSEDAPVEIQENILSALKASNPEIEKRIKGRTSQIEERAQFNKTKRTELEKELLRIVKSSHWKQAMRTVTVLTAIGIGFEKLSSPDVVRLITEGAIDQHPSLRAIYAGGLLGLLSVLALRSASQHDRLKFLNGEYKFMGVTKIDVSDEQAKQTQKFLDNFKSGGANWYIDDHHSGWLFWPKQIEIFRPDEVHDDKYDEVEMNVISAFKACMTKTWFNGLYDILAQEPREGGMDRFRLHSTLLLQAIFDLLLDGHTEATLADIGELITSRFVATADKHTHRATSELLAGLMVAANEKSSEILDRVEQLCIPIALEALSRGFSPETVEYWTSFLTYVYRDNDPRRWWPISQWIANYRLDMGSNAATVESAKMKLVNAYIINTGWHFQLEEPLLRDFFQNLDHPYKGVRDSMGSAIATIFQTRHYEGYQNLDALIAAQGETGGLGTHPYGDHGMFDDVLKGTLERIEVWRQERVPGQQSASSYTSGSKTLLTWLTLTVTNFDAGKLCPHAASLILPLLHMMDVKEDKELQVLAYQLYREIASIPFRQGQQDELIKTLVSTGLKSTLWHQRLRVLVNVQTLFFRQLFILSHQQQDQLFNCAASMLNDTQLEVRLGAMATLSGMIQCSRKEMRDNMVQGLKEKFTKTLIDNPLPKRMRAKSRADQKNDEIESSEGKTSELVIKRHSAVLGLGSLVQAFPYLSPPPSWIPEILATLANRANSDPGIVGQSVKTILSDFKKTRQDTWQTDLKAFTPEQQEDLEGVLWKSYFA